MLFSPGRNNLNRACVAAVAFAASIAVAQAQTQDQTHTAHHPTGQPAESTPPSPAGMPMQGMPRGQSGGISMMGSNAGQMTEMMTTMRAMMAQSGMLGPMDLMPLDHIAGRIAFLKAELGITAAQETQWNAFADALRAAAQSMQTERAAMMNQGASESWPERLALHERLLSDRLAALKAIEGPVKSLYRVLSEQQRQKADELTGSPMGMM
jgi:hypothetical protein